jgi:HPt (histidine-containing phosphotransfer) domain-containing protein
MEPKDPTPTATTPANVAVLQALVGSDEQTIHEFLTDFLSSTQPAVQELRTAAGQSDIGAVDGIAHRLKSSARLVGAFALADVCIALEQACKAGNGEAIVQQLPLFEATLAQVQSYIRQLLIGKD